MPQDYLQTNAPSSQDEQQSGEISPSYAPAGTLQNCSEATSQVAYGENTQSGNFQPYQSADFYPENQQFTSTNQPQYFAQDSYQNQNYSAQVCSSFAQQQNPMGQTSLTAAQKIAWFFIGVFLSIPGILVASMTNLDKPYRSDATKFAVVGFVVEAVLCAAMFFGFCFSVMNAMFY